MWIIPILNIWRDAFCQNKQAKVTLHWLTVYQEWAYRRKALELCTQYVAPGANSLFCKQGLDLPADPGIPWIAGWGCFLDVQCFLAPCAQSRAPSLLALPGWGDQRPCALALQCLSPAGPRGDRLCHKGLCRGPSPDPTCFSDTDTSSPSTTGLLCLDWLHREISICCLILLVAPPSTIVPATSLQPLATRQ